MVTEKPTLHECCVYFTTAKNKREIIGYNRLGLLQKKDPSLGVKIVERKVCSVSFDLASITHFRENLFFGFENGMVISFSVKDHAFG